MLLDILKTFLNHSVHAESYVRGNRPSNSVRRESDFDTLTRAKFLAECRDARDETETFQRRRVQAMGHSMEIDAKFAARRCLTPISWLLE